jgi:hypothetical protein
MHGAAEMTGFPRTPDEITARWLSSALRGAGHIDRGEILRVHVEPLAEGLTGPVVRVKPTLDPGSLRGAETIVVKMPTTDPDLLRCLTERGRIHREYLFFRHLASRIPNYVPRHYFVETNAKGTIGIIGLEDLSDWRTIPVGEEIADNDANSAIKTLAAIHAHWWNDARLDAYDWLMRPGIYFDGESQGQLAASGRTCFEKYSDLLSPGVSELLRRLPDALPEIVKHSSTGNLTLCSGDARGQNMFFTGEGESTRTVLIDWQTPSLTVGAADVANFIMATFDVEKRREIEGDLLRTYHAELITRGVTDYSSNELETDFRWSMFRQMIFMVRGAIDTGFGEKAIFRFRDRLKMMEDWDCIELLK